MDDITIRIIETAPRDDLIQLYKEAGFWEPAWDDNHGFIDTVVSNSAVFVGAFHGRTMIGMGRALSDLSSDAYIQDLAVLKRFRGKGIGRRIVEKLIARLLAHHVDWIGVVANPGTDRFYKEIGFEPLDGHIPLKLKPSADEQ